MKVQQTASIHEKTLQGIAKSDAPKPKPKHRRKARQSVRSTELHPLINQYLKENNIKPSEPRVQVVANDEVIIWNDKDANE